MAKKKRRYGRTRPRHTYRDPPPVGSERRLARHTSDKILTSPPAPLKTAGLGKGTIVRVIEHTEAHPLGAYGPGCYIQPADTKHPRRDERFYVPNTDLGILLPT